MWKTVWNVISLLAFALRWCADTLGEAQYWAWEKAGSPGAQES
jgi:hypothetical protein